MAEDGILEGSAVGASKASRPKKAKKPEKLEPEKKENAEKAVEASARADVSKVQLCQPEKKERGSGIVFAVLLIFAGVLFLLNNFGILPWSVWSNIWRFWPVFLILVGLQIIFGRSRIGSIFLGVFSLILVGAVALVIVASSNESVNSWIEERAGISLENLSFLGAPEERSEGYEIAADRYEGLEKRDVELKVGAGEFSVSDEAEGQLFTMNSTYYFDEQAPDVNEWHEDNTLNIDFETQGGLRLFGISPRGPKYDFVFGQKDISTDLDISLGAGEGNIVCDVLKIGETKIELGSGKFTWESSGDAVLDGSFGLNVGAGRGEVTFADEVLPGGGMDIDVGAGSVYLTVPEGVGLKVDYNIGAGVLEVGDQDLHGDGTYTSDGYDSAERKLDIRVDIGAGKVEISFN